MCRVNTSKNNIIYIYIGNIKVFETLLREISERATIDDVLTIFSNNGHKIFSVILLFAYISIFEHGFKVIALIDGHFASDVGKKFEEFSLFYYLKSIVKKLNVDYKMFFLKYTNDIPVDKKSLSYNTIEVIFFLIKNKENKI